MTTYGVLLSHAQDHHVMGTYRDRWMADDLATVITAAQPGIEAEIVHRDGDREPWLSDQGETVHEVSRRRWDDPVEAVVLPGQTSIFDALEGTA